MRYLIGLVLSLSLALPALALGYDSTYGYSTQVTGPCGVAPLVNPQSPDIITPTGTLVPISGPSIVNTYPVQGSEAVGGYWGGSFHNEIVTPISPYQTITTGE